MSKQGKATGETVSRRDFLNIAMVGGGALVAVSLSGPASAAPEKKKFSKQQAKYQPVPKSGQRCQNCALWQAPTDCQLVESPISPAGWCMLYQPKG